ncbi:unnamed protein product [Rotaria magnacalcarata]|uniref:Uncharacterized protein n=1 Tax=Rotaria magnacalcarata TaxID=392030 RepID=A0A819P655_9BILA|nr:unnamed protein product [Rotaria magnacalcarata]CAF4008679.1 unnamed protein product [Rotaria magnacalcarata]CAF4055131.1 unnamed protein product [Rotaria magnacalcarata]CAF4092236.1 unnamed protein product [Rotaria magnacalcarata]
MDCNNINGIGKNLCSISGGVLELLSEQQDLNNHIPLYIVRLQQFEKQLKQQQSYLTNKKEIIKFIQNKLLLLFDEDLI